MFTIKSEFSIGVIILFKIVRVVGDIMQVYHVNVTPKIQTTERWYLVWLCVTRILMGLKARVFITRIFFHRRKKGPVLERPIQQASGALSRTEIYLMTPGCTTISSKP